MLLNLHVKNMALIEEADINFENGLNILTGETGAGKSIVIGSINIALGQKVSADIIRKGAEYALVELAFKINSQKKIDEIKKLDYEIEELDEGNIYLSRKIYANGRSVLRINGQTVTISQVKSIASLLIDIHGQHEHQSLLNEAAHLEMVDEFGSAELRKMLQRVKDDYHKYTSLMKAYDEINLDNDKVQSEIAFLQFAIDEIDNAELINGEDAKLESKMQFMNNGQKIIQEINLCDASINGEGETGASELVSRSVRAIANVVKYDENLEKLYEQLLDIESLINDFGRDINSYSDSIGFDEEEYNDVYQRLDLINSLKNKYGRDIESILLYRDEKQELLERYMNIEAEKARYSKEIEIAKEQLDADCTILTKLRKDSAASLNKSISKSLLALNFLDVRFDTAFEKMDTPTSKGCDVIRFMISTNPGEELKPLAKIASGGEMSRIMLAIKDVLAEKDEIETLIFDEIDTGISGITAQKVGQKMLEIAKLHQVICITHLPQIAAMADEHYLIKKEAIDNSTITTIARLDYDDSIAEISRLLGGSSITESVVATAKEMKIKKS